MVQYAGFKGRLGRFIIYAVVILLALICLLPLWNIVAISFSSSDAVSANAVGLLPVKFTTAAYRRIIEDSQFWRSFGISVLRVVLTLILNMVLIILMAYPLSKSSKEFKGRNIYMNIIIFAMLFSGGMIPSYLIVKELHLLNTVWALVLPAAVPIFSVILVMNFFIGVPKALEEAAVIDGAGQLQVLLRVFIPISVPSLATVALFSIVGSWNDFFGGLIYMTKVSNYPLMTYIQALNVSIADMLKSGVSAGTLANATEVSNRNLNAAKIVVAVIPLLLIYPALQKYFITGIVVGSVKE
ncbi:carbohydrate ABC transporter permease [Paenibacillus sabinae]|uniref:Protein lplC n=1 Tax=Paenibacillus sabinae T27 TaxID=1268072 RepID=X5A1X2_9BACL|nr:carbohydrate ABC transporter permease [Paenibacillus sabinae]AHV98323.1 protein lplC [Paenibacillus sabinae T27]